MTSDRSPSPMSYESPPAPGTYRPGVIPWFVTYASLMALLYVLVLAAGIAIIIAGPGALADDAREAEGMKLQAWAMIIVGAPLALVFGIAPFLPRRRWVWIYDIVLICIGLTSVCCMPFSIPLLIFWIKPETKAWFSAG